MKLVPVFSANASGRAAVHAWPVYRGMEVRVVDGGAARNERVATFVGHPAIRFLPAHIL